MNPLYRDTWRALPLEFVVHPTLDAPALVFDEADEAYAVDYFGQILKLYERKAYLESIEKHRAAAFVADLIRKQQLLRVSLAIGVKLPGHPHVVHEFVA